jgi:Putative transposase/Transposase zinc-binding domain
MRAIEICRTAVLGGHVEECDHCRRVLISYNSCRNRHCPKCGSLARARWLHQRQGELLPVQYFHVVFTLPAAIAELALRNQKTLYDLLFRVSSETLLTIARDPKHLGAEIGFFGILHTWGQNLLFHPHVHYVIPGGGIGPDQDRWVSCLPGFFLPVRVLSALFRRRFLEELRKLFHQAKLQFPGELAPLQDPAAFDRYLQPLEQVDWVVYAKPPYAGPKQVLEYLGRYTHRVAISNRRLLSLTQGQVTFAWKDYRHPQRSRTMTLDADEFIRRFLLHSLPDGFQRIRFSGFLANCHRHEKLQLLDQLLAEPVTELLPLPQDCAALLALLTGQPVNQCPLCLVGTLHRIETLTPTRYRAPAMDSS